MVNVNDDYMGAGYFYFKVDNAYLSPQKIDNSLIGQGDIRKKLVLQTNLYR